LLATANAWRWNGLWRITMRKMEFIPLSPLPAIRTMNSGTLSNARQVPYRHAGTWVFDDAARGWTKSRAGVVCRKTGAGLLGSRGVLVLMATRQRENRLAAIRRYFRFVLSISVIGFESWMFKYIGTHAVVSLGTEISGN